MIQLLHAEIDQAVRESEPVLPGWALFPVVGKMPTRGLPWTERAAADATERAALAVLPHDGWAVACGPSGLTVIDLDAHDGGADGATEWCRFLDKSELSQGEGNPRIIGATPSGGVHLYFRAVQGVGNRVGVLPGVDVRGAGGYVVLSGPGRILTILDWTLCTLPSPAAELLSSRPMEARAIGVRDKVTDPSRVLRALLGAADFVAQTAQGSRNDALNWASHKPGREAIEAGVPADSVVAILLDAALESGLTEKEARATIRSGLGVYA